MVLLLHSFGTEIIEIQSHVYSQTAFPFVWGLDAPTQKKKNVKSSTVWYHLLAK